MLSFLLFAVKGYNGTITTIQSCPPSPPPPKERLLPINIHTIKFRTLHLQILCTPMSWPLCNCITVYTCTYEFDKSTCMLMCAIIIIKDHKMKQIINDLPKINPELYLSSSIIKNVTVGFTAIFLFNAFILSHHQRSDMPNDTDQWQLIESLIVMIIK